MYRAVRHLFHGSFLGGWMGLAMVLMVVGCSSNPPQYEGAFSSSQQVKGNAESISAPMEPTWGSVLEVLAQQGFLVQQADAKNHIILATKEIRSKEDKALSHTVTATVTLFPSSDQITRIMIAANQTTELQKNPIPGGICCGSFHSFPREPSTRPS